MYIFLDFDGVLRPIQSSPYQFDPECLASFESAVRPLPDTKIVISSTWRLAYSLRELRNLFSSSIAQRIVGVTPEYTKALKHERFHEINAYLKQQNAQDEPWIAIDDQQALFPKEAPVIITDSAQGFNDSNATELWELVSEAVHQLQAEAS